MFRLEIFMKIGFRLMIFFDLQMREVTLGKFLAICYIDIKKIVLQLVLIDQTNLDRFEIFCHH